MCTSFNASLILGLFICVTSLSGTPDQLYAQCSSTQPIHQAANEVDSCTPVGINLSGVNTHLQMINLHLEAEIAQAKELVDLSNRTLTLEVRELDRSLLCAGEIQSFNPTVNRTGRLSIKITSQNQQQESVAPILGCDLAELLGETSK